MIIILDTNIIETYHTAKLFGDKGSKLQVTECFEDNIFKVLKTLLSNNDDFHLIIPDVVVLEAQSHYENNLNNLKKKLEQINIHLLKKVNLPNITDYLSVLSSQIAESKNYVQNKIEKDFNGDIYNTNILGHSNILNKAINKIKPFKDNGEGYKDALIWQSVVKIIKERQMEKVVFISKNGKDFGKDGELHNDLLNDLIKENLNSENFRYYNSLNDFIEDGYVFQENLFDKVKNSITEEVIINNLTENKDVIRESLAEYLETINNYEYLIEVKDININKIVDHNYNQDDLMESISELKVFELTDETLYIKLQIDININYEYEISTAQSKKLNLSYEGKFIEQIFKFKMDFVYDFTSKILESVELNEIKFIQEKQKEFALQEFLIEKEDLESDVKTTIKEIYGEYYHPNLDDEF